MLLIDFVTQTRTLKITPESRRAVFACLADHTVRARDCIYDADGVIFLTLRERDYRRFAAYWEENGTPLPPTVSRYGWETLLPFLKRRPGIMAGCVFAALLILFSSLVVWRVDVICLDNDGARTEDIVDTEKVRGRLEEQGIGAGMWLPGFDARHAESHYLVGQDDVSWMAINRRGTVLSVEVRPSRVIKEDNTGRISEGEDGLLTGTNLIANADGVIVRTELRNGISLVLPEEMVVKGQILASGVFESKDGDVRFSRVSGKVFANTLRQLTVTVPLDKEETVYTGESRKQVTLSLFGREIPLPAWHTGSENVTFLQTFADIFGNSGFSAEDYDIIEDEKSLRMPDGTPLPLTLKTAWQNGKTTVTRRLSAEEARKEAAAQLAKMEEALTDAEVLSRETSETLDENGLTVTLDLFCIDNIAEISDFHIRKQDVPKEAP